MKKTLIETEAVVECPELVLSALEDATIELAYVRQLITTIGECADSLTMEAPLCAPADIEIH